jgi:hypothetical protein
MDATRRRFGSLVEWLFAASCAAGAVATLMVVAHEFRGVRAVVPVIAEEAVEAPPTAGIPADVVRVPLLLLPNTREVRLGEPLTHVVEHLGTAARLVSESFEETAAGHRITRIYSDGGVQFVLVFDDVRRNGDARVSAIFIR